MFSLRRKIHIMNTKTFFTTFFLLTCLQIPAQLELKIQSYKIDTDLKPELNIKMQLDGDGLNQGEMLVYEKRWSRQRNVRDSMLWFRGNFVNGQLDDTAWFYNPSRELTRMAVFSAERFDYSSFEAINCGPNTFSVYGIRNGADITWRSGKVESSGNYAQGKKDGLFFESYKGLPRSEIKYKLGIKNGKATVWDEHGNKLSEGFYENNEKKGPLKTYLKGVLTESHSCFNCETDSIRAYYMSGALKRESVSVNGMTVGDERSYWENGKLSSYSHFSSEGINDGAYILYHENGQMSMRIPYVEGKLQGIGESWHENGKRESLGTLKDGAYCGAYTEWHPNGKVKAKGTYEVGVKTGKWLYYDEKGKRIAEPDEDIYDISVGTEDNYYMSPPPPEIAYANEKLQIILPNYYLLNYPHEVTRKDKLGFIRTYGKIQLEATITREGLVTYKIITLLKAKEAASLNDFLAKHTDWSPLKIASFPADATMLLTLEWNED